MNLNFFLAFIESMGIHGLWPLLEPTSTAITLDALEGKRLAIDVSFWLYQAQQGYANNGFNVKNPHLILMLNRIAKLLYYKIRPVFVFDGENIPRFKKQILRDRCLKRHMKEITFNPSQKRLFVRMAHEQLDSRENSQDGFFDDSLNISPEKGREKFGTKVSVNLDIPSTSATANSLLPIETFDSSDDDLNNDDANESGIYSSKLDAQIVKLEEVKEHTRNAKLQPWQIPEDSKKFSHFQLERLIKRNNLTAQLDELRAQKVRNNVQLHLPLNGNEKKLIVTDRHMRTHVLTKSEEIQIIEQGNMAKTDLTWPKFLQLQSDSNTSTSSNENEKNHQNYDSLNGYHGKLALEKENDKEVEISNSEDDNDFIDVPNLPDEYYTGVIDNMEDNSFNKSEDDEIIEIDVPLVNQALETEEIQYIDGNDLESDGDGDEEEEEVYFRPKQSNDIANKRNNEAEGIYADCQRLFALLGLPYMQAPGEAEAQCVELERLNLVDGVVSDDSDVWLFGVNQVYKNMFSRRKEVQRYSADEIKLKLAMGRSEFIQMGMLAGGDYSRGFEQIGMVAALELVSEFVTSTKQQEDNDLEKALLSLRKVSEWILSKRGANLDAKKGPHFTESSRRIRLKKIIEANNSDEAIRAFPDVDVFQAYSKPLVDSSSQKFRWGRVEFSELEKFLEEKLGLQKQRIDQMTHGALQRWDEFMAQQLQSYQPRITDFARPLDTFGGILGMTSTLAPTDRVQKALENLKKNVSNAEKRPIRDDLLHKRPERFKSTVKRPTNLSGRINSKRPRRKPAAKKSTQQKPVVDFTLSEESSSSSSSSS